jgi:hypothetical protein
MRRPDGRHRRQRQNKIPQRAVLDDENLQGRKPKQAVAFLKKSAAKDF